MSRGSHDSILIIQAIESLRNPRRIEVGLRITCSHHSDSSTLNLDGFDRLFSLTVAVFDSGSAPLLTGSESGMEEWVFLDYYRRS